MVKVVINRSIGTLIIVITVIVMFFSLIVSDIHIPFWVYVLALVLGLILQSVTIVER